MLLTEHLQTIKQDKQVRQYKYKYIKYTDIAKDLSSQKIIMGRYFHRKFRYTEKEGRIKLHNIISDLLANVDYDILRGAEVDFGGFTIHMDKVKTNMHTQTKKNGFLYIPIIKFKKIFKRVPMKYLISPKLVFQMNIKKAIDEGLYNNI